jgi:hypothetical protein
MKREEAVADLPCHFFPAAREPTRRQWRRRVRTRAATVPALPEAFLAVSWIFGGYYVFFYLCDVLSVLF